MSRGFREKSEFFLHFFSKNSAEFRLFLRNSNLFRKARTHRASSLCFPASKVEVCSFFKRTFEPPPEAFPAFKRTFEVPPEVFPPCKSAFVAPSEAFSPFKRTFEASPEAFSSFGSVPKACPGHFRPSKAFLKSRLTRFHDSGAFPRLPRGVFELREHSQGMPETFSHFGSVLAFQMRTVTIIEQGGGL